MDAGMVQYSRTYKFHTSTVNLIIGDCCASDADVLVLICDKYALMKGGIPMSLAMSLPSLAKDLRKYDMQSIKGGSVLLFSAGDLRQKNLMIIVKDYGAERESHLEAGNAIRKAFLMVQAMGFSKIALNFSNMGMTTADTGEMTYIQKITEALFETSRPMELEVFFPDMMMSKMLIDELADKAANYNLESAGENNDAIDVPVRTGTYKEHAPQNSVRCHDAFISYSRKNSREARYINDQLSRLGLDVWMDVNDINRGEDYELHILDALDNSKCILFLSSQDSNASKSVMKEIRYALFKEKKIIPIRLDDSPYARQLQMDLLTIEYAEFEESNSFICEMEDCIKGG